MKLFFKDVKKCACKLQQLKFVKTSYLLQVRVASFNACRGVILFGNFNPCAQMVNEKINIYLTFFQKKIKKKIHKPNLRKTERLM